MKKLFLSLASVPLFAGFAVANADELAPSDEPTTLEPTTLDAATLDGITAAGANREHRCGGCDGGDTVFQNNESILSPQVNLAANIGVLSYQSNEQSNFNGNIND
jgi:hypothetical protein